MTDVYGALVWYACGMSKMTLKQHRSDFGRGSATALLAPAEKLAIARSTRGMWKRPLKQSLRTLARIRKGLDRNIG